MKNTSRSCLGFILMLAISAASLPEFALGEAKIDPAIKSFYDDRADSDVVRVIIVMAPEIQGVVFPMKYDRIGVTRYLRHLAAVRYRQLRSYIDDQLAPGSARIREIHWISTSFTVDASRYAIRQLGYAPDVNKIYFNHPIQSETPVHARWAAPHQQMEKPLYNFEESGLLDLMERHPQVTGRGVLLGQVDTGVDATHPALHGKIAGFYDGRAGRTTEPYDSGNHGTHTAGTMIGDRTPGNWVGVAPEARLLAAGPLSGYADMLASMEYLLDPDGNPDTADMPRAVNNSWNCNGAPDLELFYRAISAWEAAGVLPVFSAGNSGPRPGSITRPKEHPATFAVAALGPSGQIAPFSSRGLSIYQGREIPKPDIAAPGVDIRSAVPNGRYAAMSGTSMAAPHVAGTTALLYQVDPHLTPLQVRSILVNSATVVDGGWNITYGHGRLNILKAVEMTLDVQRMRWNGIRGLSSFAPAQPDAGSWLSGPERMKVLRILELGEVQTSFAEAYALPSSWEGEGWLSPEEL